MLISNALRNLEQFLFQNVPTKDQNDDVDFSDDGSIRDQNIGMISGGESNNSDEASQGFDQLCIDMLTLIFDAFEVLELLKIRVVNRICKIAADSLIPRKMCCTFENDEFFIFL